MRRMIITSSLLLALSASAMASQVYKWVDEQGVTHFGSQPPQGQQATSVNTATPPPRPTEQKPAAPNLESAADPEQAAVDKKVKREVAAQKAELKKFCETVRTNLAQLENNPRVRVEIDGEMQRMNEEQREQRINEAKKSINENCK
ncbi:MAG: DUF4124 domain-containing protein [Pseudomonas sp.]|uniref:DUF4124 domain-containing protein n=1 Tax=Pseudomonas sp. TaxID=306 RepID=UPI003D132ACA